MSRSRERGYSAFLPVIKLSASTIIRGRPDPVVRFERHISPTFTPTEVRLPVAAFTGYQLPPGVYVNFGDSNVLTEEDLIDFGRLHWIPSIKPWKRTQCDDC
jgi:hypothetical protein